MAEVNYMASTSNSEPFQEPSVEIIEPKSKRSSIASKEEEKPFKSQEKDQPNRPSDELWRQQKLPAWQPILTPDTVLPAFFLLGVAFIPIGIGLLISSNQVQEISFDYTECIAYEDKAPNAKKCYEIKGSKCVCYKNFTLEEDFKAPVFFYYGLSNYYQNHRRYVQSRDDSQLSGKTEDLKDLSSFCDPFKAFITENESRPIAPCGMIANSLFNDSFSLYLMNSDHSSEHIDLIQTEIAWPTDKEIKFDNPKDFTKTAKPLNWQKAVNDLDPNNPNNNGYKNEHLIVWMRTAALPSFRKLWGRINHDQSIVWRTSLPKGNYRIKIDYNYPMIFGKYYGSKKIIISNTSWLGGKNNFLGIAYIVVGGLCLILWAVFLVIFKKYSQNPKDMVDIGPKTPYQMANYRSTDLSPQLSK